MNLFSTGKDVQIDTLLVFICVSSSQIWIYPLSIVRILLQPKCLFILLDFVHSFVHVLNWVGSDGLHRERIFICI